MSDSQYSTEGTIKEPNLLEGAQDDLLAAGKSAMMGNTDGLFKGLFGAAKGAFEANAAHTKTKKNNTSPADVIQWAGCKDSQTVSGDESPDYPITQAEEVMLMAVQSADTEEEGKATGAMSYVSRPMVDSAIRGADVATCTGLHCRFDKVPTAKLPTAPGVHSGGDERAIHPETAVVRLSP